MKSYLKTKLGVLYLGDCLETMPKLKLKKVKLLLTDPPYKIHIGGAGITRKRKNFQALKRINTFNSKPFFKIIKKYISPFHAYIFCSKNQLIEYIKFGSKYNWDILSLIKRNPIPTKKNKYLPDMEYILFIRQKRGCYFNNNLTFDYYRKAKTITVKQKYRYHIAEKQVKIIEELLLVSSQKGDLILDPYAGSGTTVVACENLGRKWILIEKEKSDCKIIKKRLKQFDNQIQELR